MGNPLPRGEQENYLAKKYCRLGHGRGIPYRQSLILIPWGEGQGATVFPACSCILKPGRDFWGAFTDQEIKFGEVAVILGVNYKKSLF